MASTTLSPVHPLFAVAVTAAPTESLAATVALLEETSFWSLGWGKIQDLSSSVHARLSGSPQAKELGHFERVIKQRTESLVFRSRPELVLLALGGLSGILGVRARHLASQRDLDDWGDDIADTAIAQLRNKTAGKSDINKRFLGTRVGDLVEYELISMFAEMNVRLEQLSVDRQENLISQLKQFLASLPKEQQQLILDRIGAKELTDAALRKAIATGTLWTALAGAVNIFGFAFYMAAAKLLSILSLHLLPFGAYVFLSSTIAVLSSAWIIPISFIVLAMLFSRQSRGMRQELARKAITMLYLAGLDVLGAGRRDDTHSETVREWQRAMAVREECRRAKLAAEQSLAAARSSLGSVQAEIARCRNAKQQVEQRRRETEEQLKQLVGRHLEDIASGAWGPRPQACAVRVVALRQMQASVESDYRGRPRYHTGGLGNWIRGKWQDVSAWARYESQRNDLAAANNKETQACFAEVIFAWEEGYRALPGTPAALLGNMDRDRSTAAEIDRTIGRLQAEELLQRQHVSRQEQALENAVQAVAQAEARYYGLGAT